MTEFHEAVKSNDQLRPHLSKVMEDLNPIRVLGLLERISKEDCDLLDIHGRRVRSLTPAFVSTRAAYDVCTGLMAWSSPTWQCRLCASGRRWRWSLHLVATRMTSP